MDGSLADLEALVRVAELGTLAKAARSLHLSPSALSRRLGKLEERLGVLPGAVTPFAVVNDPGQRVRVVLDRALLARAALKFHPLVNTATTVVSPDGLLRFLEAAGHPPAFVDLG